mgnify:CR=1 FL=1
MTGTVTRNNISECAPQLELLYNNSYNMLSWAEDLYCYEKDDCEEYLNCSSNPYYGQPFPAYKAGYSLFAESHLPERITVFGVGKKTQDIYNADVLNKSSLTRSSPGLSRRSPAKRYVDFIKPQFHSLLQSVKSIKRPWKSFSPCASGTSPLPGIAARIA